MPMESFGLNYIESETFHDNENKITSEKRFMFFIVFIGKITKHIFISQNTQYFFLEKLRCIHHKY